MEPGRPGDTIVGAQHALQIVGDRLDELGADVDRVVGGIGRLVAHCVGAAAVLLDFAAGDVARPEDRPAIHHTGRQVELPAIYIHLVDVRHDAQQAESADEEFEELHVANAGVVAGEVVVERAAEQAALHPGFKGARAFLAILVVDPHAGVDRADRAVVEVVVDDRGRARIVETTRFETDAPVGEQHGFVGSLEA